MKAKWCIVICIALLTASCSTKWAMRTAPAETPYLLSSSQSGTMIGHTMSIKGFEEKGGSLRSLVFGKDQAAFERPVAIAVARDGRFAVADTGLKCVHLYIPSEATYRQLTGVKDQSFSAPVSVAFDSLMRLYVSDSSLSKVFVFDQNGKYSSTIDSVAFIRPTGIAYDSEKKLLFVLDTIDNKVYKINDRGEVLSSFGERGSEKGQFNFPSHIGLSSYGLIYIVDTMNFRLQVFNDSGVLQSSFGRHGNGSGDFAMPKGVAVDSTGTIYIVDNLFDNIQLFDWEGNFLYTIGRRGTERGEFWLPTGIFIDGKDRLYVCDTFNQRIEVFQIIKN